jgi:hypothetical protein
VQPERGLGPGDVAGAQVGPESEERPALAGLGREGVLERAQAVEHGRLGVSVWEESRRFARALTEMLAVGGVVELRP